jgi:hypothetical protein
MSNKMIGNEENVIETGAEVMTVLRATDRYHIAMAVTWEKRAVTTRTIPISNPRGCPGLSTELL